VHLFSELINNSDELNLRNLDRYVIWKKLFPGKDFNYGIMKNLIYDLRRLSEKFLLSEVRQSDEFINQKDLLDTYYNRDLKDLYEPEFLKMQKSSYRESINLNLIREDYYHTMWRNYKTRWNFGTHLSHTKKFNDIINPASDYLVASFLIHSFIVFHNITAQRYEHNYSEKDNSLEIFLKNSSETGLINSVIDNINPDSKDVADVLRVYYSMYLCLINPDSERRYYDFKESVLSNSKLFSKKDLQALFIMLRNCLTFSTSGINSVGFETLEIYDSMIEKKIFLMENESAWNQEFISYVIISARLGKTESIVKFVNKFINRIQKDTRTNILLFSEAHICFTKGEYEKALEISSKISFELFPVKYYIKDLQLKIFYELNNYDAFMMAADSFSHFISKNKSVSSKWKIKNKMLCSNIGSLFKLRENLNGYDLMKFKEKVNYKHLHKSSWLAVKIKELESGRIE
jgi:hypothetical protein